MGNQYGVHGAGGAQRCAHTLRFREIRPARSTTIAGPLYKVRCERSPDLNRYTVQSVFTTVLSGVRHGLRCRLSLPLESAELPGRGITVDRNATEPVPEEDVVQHDQSVAAKRGAHQYRHEQVRLLRRRWIVPFLHWPARREEWHRRSRSVGELAYMVSPPMLASAHTLRVRAAGGAPLRRRRRRLSLRKNWSGATGVGRPMNG